ncbi:MAG: hypothetical protein ACO23R_18525, partial [bacterium]
PLEMVSACLEITTTRDIARQIGMREHEQDVLTVLNEFFLSTDDGFISPRADKEIQQYKDFIEAGKRGAAKRWAKAPDSPPISPPNAGPIATNNHKPITNNQEPVKKAPRGSRLPKDWIPNAELAQWSKAERPDLDLRKVLMEFRDYWSSVAGQKGVKLDWDATWRNWVRNQKAEKQSFAQQAADIARTTVPGSNAPDPALLKIEADRQKAAPMPAHIRDRINSVLRKV